MSSRRGIIRSRAWHNGFPFAEAFLDEGVVQPEPSRPMPWRRMLLRGEATIASIGIALAAILLGAMGAAGWWMLHTQQAAAEAAREQQVEAVGNLLAPSTEALLAADDLTAVRRLVAEAGRSYNLTQCRIVLPDGQVVAAIDASQDTIPKLPASWSAGNLPPEPLPKMDGVVSLRYPLSIAGRGKADLEVEAELSQPIGAFWGAQSGVGAIGAVALLALLAVYRKMRSRLRAVGAIREALLAMQDGQAAGTALMVGPDLGPEARAWNEMIAESERQRKQAAADKAREALIRRRQGNGDLDAACDAMSQGLLLVDERHLVKYANGAAAAFLNSDRERLAGTDIGQWLQVENVLAAVRDVASGRVRRRTVIDVERTIDDNGVEGEAGRTSGGNGVLRFSIRPVRRDDSASAMLIIEDITQQKVAEEARANFVAQATHELRTPLTNIRLYVETAIEDGEKDPATRARCLNVINGETRRLERIVGEMLSVSEIEAGSFKINRDDVRLEALFAEVEEDFRAQAAEKQVSLTFRLPPKLPVIQGDRDKVVLAIHNLVGNALKYTLAGGKVTVEVTEDGKQLSVAVQDTGIGIAPEDQPRIFERFYRARDKRVAKVTGTGLGLTLAREVARLHGGDINVESQLDQGSTFTLVLPVKAA
jgi:signal transduction histidine kinase